MSRLRLGAGGVGGRVRAAPRNGVAFLRCDRDLGVRATCGGKIEEVKKRNRTHFNGDDITQIHRTLQFYLSGWI